MKARINENETKELNPTEIGERFINVMNKLQELTRIKSTMTGRLHKMPERGWVVAYTQEMEDSPGVLETINFPLHSDDEYELFELEERFDNLEARIAANPIVEFEIVMAHKMSGIIRYAKLKNHDKTN